MVRYFHPDYKCGYIKIYYIKLVNACSFILLIFMCLRFTVVVSICIFNTQGARE